jgi:hypothetical protein
MRKIFFILLLLLINFYIFSDQTDDRVKNDSAKNKKDFIVKFRGSISFVVDYMFEIRDGVPTSNHFQPVNYVPLNYTDKGDPDNKHHTGDGRVIGGTFGGTQFELYFDYSFIIPFLRFDNPLTKNNNIKFTLLNQLSPVTHNVGFSVTLTPVAFLTFQSGFLIGYGWDIPNFAAGFGINDHGVINRLSFAGPQIQGWFSSTFQFDLAFILPKQFQRWTHIVMLATPSIKYQGLLTISDYQPYMYQECPGEKMNGWKFVFEYLTGYRFYIIEDDTGENEQFLKTRNKNFIITIGMYVWLDYLNMTHYYDSPMKNGWGSDFAYVNFGPAMQFDLPNNFYLKLFFFFQNDKQYTSETVGNRDFRDRKYEDWYVYFKWLGLFFGWNF